MGDQSMRYVGAPDRRERILATLRTTGFLSVTALARELGVSDMTVRRDLRRLAEQGQVQVVHGGVSLLHGTLQTPDFAARANTNAAAKRAIAKQALDYVDATDTIALDAGTTTYEVAQALPDDFAGTVVTNSVPVVQLFLHNPGKRLIGLGGDLVQESQAFAGPMTAEDASRLRVRTFFLGAAAVDAKGVYVAADIERPTKLALMDIADRVVLLVDNAKFAHREPVVLCDLDRIDALISDRSPGATIEAALAAHDVELRTARSGRGEDRYAG